MKKTLFFTILFIMILGIPFLVYAKEESIIEFEKGTLIGTNTKVKTLEKASNGKYVKMNDNKGSIELTIPADHTGLYRMYVSYELSSSNSKTQLVSINDDYESKYSFPPTESNQFQEVGLGIIKLKEGNNKVVIKAIDGYQSFDYLYVKPEQDQVIENPKTTINYSFIIAIIVFTAFSIHTAIHFSKKKDLFQDM